MIISGFFTFSSFLSLLFHLFHFIMDGGAIPPKYTPSRVKRNRFELLVILGVFIGVFDLNVIAYIQDEERFSK